MRGISTLIWESYQCG